VKVGMAEYPFLTQHQNEEQNWQSKTHYWQHTHSLPNRASGLRFQHEENPNLQFIVAFGMTRDFRVWSDIELEISRHEDLQGV